MIKNCNYSAPPALIVFFNPIIALQMLIFYACGLQIRTSAAPIIWGAE